MSLRFFLTKQAEPKMTLGSPLARYSSGTIGRLDPNTLFLRLAVDSRAYNDPYASLSNNEYLYGITGKTKDSRSRLLRELMLKMQAGSNGQLDDVAVHLGGVNTWDDLKRTLTNPRTTLAGKLIGAVSLPILNGSAMFSRGPFYNPLAHSATVYSDNPALLSHELGHAIDMNPGPPRKNKTCLDYLKNEIKNIPSDIYRTGKLSLGIMSRYIPLPFVTPAFTSLIEGAANMRSYAALKKSMTPEQLKIISDLREQSLPGAYSSYLSDMILPGSQLIVSPLVALGNSLVHKSKGTVQQLNNKLLNAIDAEKIKNGTLDGTKNENV